MAGARDADKGIELSSQDKRSFHWELWLRFLSYLELEHDPFLKSIKPIHHPKLGVAFAKAYRAGEFQTKGNSPDGQGVKGGTVKAALGNISQTFRANECPDPFKGQDGQLHYLLQHQLKAYEKLDPKAKGQKAVPASVIRKVIESASTPLDEHIADLIGAAYFFACRSCEYSETSGDRKTNIIEVGNLQFFKGKRELDHSDPLLEFADVVAVTFVLQKNNTKYETINQQATKDPGGLCPVQRWARIVQRVRSYTASDASTPVNLFCDFTKINPKTMTPGAYHRVTAKNIETALRNAARLIGRDNLGFDPEELGTHSLRSGAAMAMFLTGTPVYVIMLIGRWSSDAFLRYIRPQVQDFTAGVSRNMIRTDFYTTPDVNIEDPKMCNHRDNFRGRGVCGLSAAAYPQFSLFH